MIGKIKYSYIPKNNSLDAILSSLAHAIKATDAYQYKVIDNSSLGIRMYPKEIKDNVLRVKSDTLLETVNDIASDDETEIILVNGFDIDLDMLKEDYCDIVRDKDILICINNIKELENHDSNISIVIDPEITDLEDDEWEVTKEDILSSLDKAQEKITKALALNKENKTEEGMASLLSLFGLDSLYDKKADTSSSIYDLDEIDIKEQYSHVIDGKEMFVSITTTGEIVIDSEDEFVTIPKNQIEFLMDTLNKLVK